MDKLKTRVLFISLVILALVSISAVAAADDADVISANQDDFDLSEETVSDVEEVSDDSNVLSSAAPSDVLSADGDAEYTLQVDYRSTSGPQTSTAKIYAGGSFGLAKLVANSGVKPGNPSRYNFTYHDVRYVFNHWEIITPDGNVPLDDDYRVVVNDTGESYTLHYVAIYDEILPGNLTVNNIDLLGHGSHMWCTTADNVNYQHTYSTPPDIPNGAVFLYWEREDTGDKFYDGDVLSVNVNEYKDKTLVINVYAVYNIETQIELEEITGYVEDVVDITATITDKVNNEAVPGGTATLTIDWTKKLENGLLMSGTYTQTVNVEDGQAIFKDVTLSDPGTYSYKVEYSGYDYNQPAEGINKYLATEADSKLNALPLDTTTTSDDVSGTAGDKVTITADIVDQNGHKVQNGTAVLKINGKEYKTEVKDGKATFTGVELPSESTEATIEYLGNDYYNPSNTTIQITVTQPELPGEPVVPEEPTDEPATPAAEKAIPVTPAAGNPIALVVLALLTLVSTVSLGRK